MRLILKIYIGLLFIFILMANKIAEFNFEKPTVAQEHHFDEKLKGNDEIQKIIKSEKVIKLLSYDFRVDLQAITKRVQSFHIKSITQNQNNPLCPLLKSLHKNLDYKNHGT